MKIRPKLASSPLGYTLSLVDETATPYQAFGKTLWADEQVVPGTLKELVFIRTSVINACPT